MLRNIGFHSHKRKTQLSGVIEKKINENKNIPLEEILSEDTVIDELQNHNQILINYLTKEKIKQMIDYIIKEPPDDTNYDKGHKFPWICSQLFNIENSEILKFFYKTNKELEQEENENKMDIVKDNNNKENYFKKMKRAYTPNYRKNLYDKEKDYHNKRTKSKERYEMMKKDLENKFIKEHPFQPQIHSGININRYETEEERLNRLSKPKTIQITERMKQKEFNEEEKFREENNNYPNNVRKNVDPQKVSNRLYKLHEQIKENKEKLKREFEDSKLKECSF